MISVTVPEKKKLLTTVPESEMSDVKELYVRPFALCRVHMLCSQGS